ncbi:MAG: aminopeptidase N, partial [Panacagrimonas sp.]
MIYRSDYRPSDFLLDRIELDVQIEEMTTVDARLSLRRRPGADATAPLVLNGRAMRLLGLELDGQVLAPQRYRVEPECLLLHEVPEQFNLRVRTQLDPEHNTALE